MEETASHAATSAIGQDPSAANPSSIVGVSEYETKIAAAKADMHLDEVPALALWLQGPQRSIHTLWLDKRRYYDRMISPLYALGAHGIKVAMSRSQNLSWWLVAPMLLLLAVLLGGFEVKATLWHFLWSDGSAKGIRLKK
ncbi:MAG: hypothetical protein Q9215_004649 [Flavoplaca cf. flavocitrina]